MARFLPIVAIIVTLGAAASALGADEPAQNTPIFGGSGGRGFSLSCGAGYVLTGLRGRTGTLVDRVGLLCRFVRADGTLGAETTRDREVGGTGGGPASRSCPPGQVVSGLTVRTGSYVDEVRLLCGTWNAAQRTWSGRTELPQGFGLRTPSLTSTFKSHLCELRRQPAVGIRGRSGGFVDALGLTCNEP